MAFFKQCLKVLSSQISYSNSLYSFCNRTSLIYRNGIVNIDQLQCLLYKQLHSSNSLYKRRKTAEERKSTRIIEYSPKAKGEIVGVWKDMTALELAEVLNKDIHYIREIFLNEVNSPHTVISDLKLLQQALKRSGRRMIIIGKPTNHVENSKEQDAVPRPPPDRSQLKPRPPVVTVMGHVDHGKTTLLDALRHSSIVKQEFGGITQHIGAFLVILENGAHITFLDTPGHAAFSAMRARGANVTDIVILVVAADDGVMEQTTESVRMARSAGVPIVVAINKIDSRKADVERTENMLAEVGIQVERLGGDTQAIPVSALKKQNLNNLTEALILQAELLEIGADPTGPVEAVVVESKVHPNRGKLCTVIVQRGTLKKGDILVAGTAMAKVRTLKNADGEVMNHVSPGYPVEIEGWRNLPPAGEQVLEVESERRARNVLRIREDAIKLKKLEEDQVEIDQKDEQHRKEYKETLLLKRKLGRFRLKRDGPRKPEIIEDDSGTPKLHVLVKADVDGTLEAILDTLDSYDSQECDLDLIHYGVGSVTQNDLELAKLFNGIIYAFNVDCPTDVKISAEESDVEIRHYNVIYKLIDDVKDEISTRLPVTEIEEVVGKATVLQQFDITQGKKKVPVAGCRCTNGNLKRSGKYKLYRNGELIHSGNLSSLRHLKSEVDVIKADMECGIQLLDSSVTFKQGDTLVCTETKFEQRKTDWDPGF